MIVKKSYLKRQSKGVMFPELRVAPQVARRFRHTRETKRFHRRIYYVLNIYTAKSMSSSMPSESFRDSHGLEHCKWTRN